MTPEQVIDRGHRAEALLKNELLNEALETILERISRQWLATKREANIDTEQREELHARANAIQEFRGQLMSWLNDAVHEKALIDRAEKRRGVK